MELLTYIQIWLGLQTALTVLLTAKKIWWTPRWGLFNEVCWITYIIYTAQYGLLPMNAILLTCWIYAICKWTKGD